MVLRRSVLERETFDEELPGYSFGEDYDFWVRVGGTASQGYTIVASPCTSKRLGEGSSPAKVAYSRLANHWHFYQRGISHLPWPWSLVRDRFHVRQISVEIFGRVDARGDIKPARNSAAMRSRSQIF